jgi:hypothetical protein
LHALAWQQLAARYVLGAGSLATTKLDLHCACPQVIDHTAHGRSIGQKIRRPGVKLRL